MEADKIVILNMAGYKLFSTVYHMSQQKSGVFWGELKRRQTKPI